MKLINTIFHLVLLITIYSTIHISTAECQTYLNWVRCYGGSQSDYAEGLLKTDDGGYLMVGSTNSTDGDISVSKGDHDVWVVKTDSLGDILWEKSYGGTGVDIAVKCTKAVNGGYVILAVTWSNDGNITGFHGGGSTYDIWIIKIDDLGNLEWQKCYGGSGLELAGNILTVGNSYTFVGTTSSNDGDLTGYTGWSTSIWLVNIDSVGNINWSTYINNQKSEGGEYVSLRPDGSYIVAGHSHAGFGIPNPINCYGEWDVHLTTFDSSGNLDSVYCYGGPQGEYAYFAKPTNDGGVIFKAYVEAGGGQITGFHTSNPGSYGDIWVVKLDSNFQIQWQRCIGGSHNEGARVEIIELFDGSFLSMDASSSMDGDITNYFGGNDIFIYKLDQLGNVIHAQNIGGTAYDNPSQFILCEDSTIIVAGHSGSNDIYYSDCNYGLADAFLMHLDLNFTINKVTGKLYADLNGNNVLDSVDIPLNRRSVLVSGSNYYSLSNNTGDYVGYTQSTGNITAIPQAIANFAPNPASHSINFTGVNQIDSLNDFAYQSIGIAKDLCANITNISTLRAGRMVTMHIDYINRGNVFQAGTINLIHEPELTFDTASVIPISTINDSITWQIDTLAPFESGKIIVKFNASTSLVFNDSLTTSLTFYPVTGDINPLCNFEEITTIVRGSFDPNEIVVDKVQIVTSQLIDPQLLNYTIYFQNTGNDTAFDIRILNRIPPEVDLTSLVLIGSSHPMNSHFQSDTRLMSFEFENILLPDSAVDQDASNGYIRYRILTGSNIMWGDTIKNQAHIYFDFNAPINTNRAKTAIISLVDIPEGDVKNIDPITVYPNPTIGELFYQINNFERNSDYSMRILNIVGQELTRSEKLHKQGSIDLSAFNDGLYFLIVEINGITSVKKFIVSDN